jgi:hypothetical protein
VDEINEGFFLTGMNGVSTRNDTRIFVYSPVHPFLLQSPLEKNCSGKIREKVIALFCALPPPLWHPPVAMTLYYQGSGIPVIQMNGMRHEPPMGGRAGAGGLPLKAKKSVAEI